MAYVFDHKQNISFSVAFKLVFGLMD